MTAIVLGAVAIAYAHLHEDGESVKVLADHELKEKLDGKDTTTALGEMDLAVQIRTDDPVLRYIYGYALATSGKYPEAEAQLRKAIEVDGAFAAPYHVLGLVLDGQAKGSEALAQYRSFLARASQSDARRKEAEERVRELAIKDDR